MEVAQDFLESHYQGKDIYGMSNSNAVSLSASGSTNGDDNNNNKDLFKGLLDLR